MTLPNTSSGYYTYQPYIDPAVLERIAKALETIATQLTMRATDTPQASPESDNTDAPLQRARRTSRALDKNQRARLKIKLRVALASNASRWAAEIVAQEGKGNESQR